MKTDLLILIEKFISEAKLIHENIDIDLTVRNLPMAELGCAVNNDNWESYKKIKDSFPNENNDVAYLKVNNEVTFISKPI